MTDSAAMVATEIRAPLAGVVYEGVVSVNDLGMVIQDVGNGVGILHRSDALKNVRLGEIMRVQYPRLSGEPVVDHLSTPAPSQTASLKSTDLPELQKRSITAAPAQTALFTSEALWETPPPPRPRSPGL